MTSEKIIVKVDPDLEDLIPLFLENTRKDIAAINLALSQSDRETVRRISHGMKGYGSGYGFEYISAAGRAMEAAALEDNPQAIRERLQELNDYLDKVAVVCG